MALSGEPVSTSVFSRPRASIRTAANTKVTSEMPLSVRMNVTGRLTRLLRMYTVSRFESRAATRRTIRNGIV